MNANLAHCLTQGVSHVESYLATTEREAAIQFKTAEDYDIAADKSTKEYNEILALRPVVEAEIEALNKTIAAINKSIKFPTHITGIAPVKLTKGWGWNGNPMTPERLEKDYNDAQAHFKSAAYNCRLKGLGLQSDAEEAITILEKARVREPRIKA